MNRIEVRLEGFENLEAKLIEKNSIRFEGVATMHLVNIFNRARRRDGTPVDSGAMRSSLRYEPPKVRLDKTTGAVGYLIEYAPHVEFGHRLNGGGYIKGQHFLKKNVDKERRPYLKSIEKELKR